VRLVRPDGGGAYGRLRRFTKALGAYARQIRDDVRDLLSGPDESAMDRLHEFVAAGARFVIDDAERLGCMAGKFAHEVGNQDEEARAVIRRSSSTSSALPWPSSPSRVSR
jgi:hypothetical protein